MKFPTTALGYLCLATSMALVGSYVALSKPLTAVMPLFLLGWLRFGIGATAMASWIRKPPSEAPMSPATKKLVFLESFFGNFLFSVCMLLGVSLTTVMAAGVIMSAIPACVAILSRLFLKERVTPRVAIAIALAIAGITLFTLSRDNPDATKVQQSWVGNLLIVGAVLCESVYAVIGKQLTNTLSSKRICALINLWGLVLMTPLGAYQALHFDFAVLTAWDWISLVFYALAASVGTVWLWMTGLKTVPASKAGVFTVMLPTTAALIGVVMLGEDMNLPQMSAFALALAGVVLCTLPSRQSGRSRARINSTRQH